MASSKLDSRGRLTLPKAVRDALGAAPGDSIVFVPAGKDAFVIRAKTLPVAQLKGLLARPGRVVSIDEMDAAIVDGATRRRSSSKRA